MQQNSSQATISKYYYKIKTDGTICLLRCYGETGEVTVPSSLDGRRVTEIGPYCFAQNNRLKEGDYLTAFVINENRFTKERHQTAAPLDRNRESAQESLLFEQCGRDLLRVILPDCVTTLSSYAFYNCRFLKELTLPAQLIAVGNDVFMNCTRLHKLNLTGSHMEKSSLHLLLTQISWNVEVDFQNPVTRETEAKIFYPEFLEYYEELGPAHVLEIQVSGEGFRARKCFKDGILLFREYDAIFPRACAEEPVTNLCRMAFYRLHSPSELSMQAKENYVSYIKEHSWDLARLIFTEEEEELSTRLSQLKFLYDNKYMDSMTLEELILFATEKQIPEATATFIQWKRQASGGRKKRYEF